MSNVSKQNPAVSDASTWFDLGCTLQDAERYQEALSAFKEAQAIDPNFPSLRHWIAGAYFFLKNYTKALDLFEALVRESPRDARAWSGLSMSAYRCRKWARSIEAAERAFGIAPNDSVQLYNYSIILTEFRRFKRARHLLERAVSLDPENGNFRLELGLMQLAAGDYKNGWKMLESQYRDSAPFSSLASRWCGESLAHKVLMIWPAPWQGHGDSILFARFALALAERVRRSQGENSRIVLCCHDPVSTLLARSLVEYCNELFVAALSKGVEPHHFTGRRTLQTSLVFLPLWLGETTPDKFPYLKADPLKVAAWRKRLVSDKNLKIGLAWTGRADHPRNDLRSFPILDLANRLKDIPDVTFYSLQREHPDQAKAAGLIDFTSELMSFDDTAALVSNLDLVIAMDGSIAHLAGALDIRAWVLVDVSPYWGWGRYERTTPWYRSVRIYRQQKMHDWASVFEEIWRDLADLAHEAVRVTRTNTTSPFT